MVDKKKKTLFNATPFFLKSERGQ